MAATCEEKIERLSCTQNCLEVRARSKSRDCWGHSKREEEKRRCHQVQFEDPPAPNCPSGQRMESGEEATTTEGSDLEEPPELGLEVASFLRGSLGTSKDKGNMMPHEPMVTEFSQWVLWRANNCETPSWWAELSVVPETGDHKKLPREVQALFWLPQQIKELGMKGG